MWIPREIEGFLVRVAQERPALILSGPRQAGKTSLLQRVFPKYNYVCLDIPLDAAEAEESGETFLQKHPPPLVVDEVQYAPQLFRYLKRAIDRERDRMGQFCLTGSQKFSLMAKVTESLAGRCAVIQCYSLSAREYSSWKRVTMTPNNLLHWIFQGGYPEIHARSLEPERFYADYLATYLERDVLQILKVRDLRDFDRFLRLCAIRSGQLVSYNSFATDIGVSPNTIKSWFSILVTSGIVTLLEPYYQNLGKRIVKSPKLYFLDTGLACYLAGLRSVDDLKRSDLLGPLFETHALGQILRHYANQGKRAEVYFYRDHYGHEVDFLIPVGRALKLFECKWAENPSLDVKGFREIEKQVRSDRILSRTLLTPVPGLRRTSSGIVVEDTILLKSLQT